MTMKLGDQTIPVTLREAVENGRLLVFCGAGISVLAPSHLPTWWSFNVALLESAKSAALAAVPGLPAVARAAVESLSLDRFPVETFSEKIVEAFAGSTYFPLLKVLESDRTNANHRALAELARRRQVRAIVTTNFDTLIERAFREAGLGLTVLTTRADHAAARSPDLCALLKIHGSVTTETSLVDTVSQKLRGLPVHLRAQLAALYREFHVLVLGFSGADLNFGSDYLALSSIDPDGPGITWVVRPGQPVSPHVRDAVKLAGSRGAVIEAELPAFFTRLGLTLEDGPAIDAAMAKERSEAAVREAITSFYEEPHIGPFATVALCSRLLSELGDFAVVDALHEAVAGMEEVSGKEVGLGVGAMFLVLGSHHMQRGAVEKAEKWFQKLLGFHHTLIRMQTLDGRKLPAPVALETRQNLAGAFNNLALCAMHLGKLDEARQQLALAESAARDPESRRLLCRILVVGAEIAKRGEESADRVLEKLRQARAFAAAVGESATLAETPLCEADILISVFELDAALRRLREGRPFFRFHNTLEMQVRAAKTLANVARLRHRFAAGVEILVRIRRKCLRGGAADFARKALLNMIELFAMCMEVRTKLLAELDAAIAAEPERELLQSLRDALAAGKFDEPLQIRMRPFGLGERELEARRVLAEAEGRGLLEYRAQALANLCHVKYEEAEFARLADLAEALRVAARRAASPGHRFTALNYLGIAREQLGDLPAAREIYRAALASDPPSDVVASLRHNLALVEMRLGNLDVAESLLREALQLNLADAHDNDAANQIRFLAQIEARRGDFVKAVRVLDDAAEIIARAPDPRIRPTLALARGEFERRGSSEPTPLSWAALHRPQADADAVSREEIATLRREMKSPADLGNLALAALAGDFVDEAIEIIGEAEKGYLASGDQLGLSRCLSNRADAAIHREKWDEAIDLIERAVAIRRSVGDIDGQVKNLATLAIVLARNGEEDRALDVARDVGTLGQDRTPSEAQLKALYVAMTVHGERGEAAEAVVAARHFLEVFPAVERVEEMRDMLPHVEQLACAETARIPASTDELSPVLAAMAEAERLQRAGRWDDALAVLDGMDLSALATEDRAGLLATRGNVLQSAGRLAESSTAFKDAAALFHPLGNAKLAARAEQHRIVNLRREGKLDEAEEQMRASLESLPAGPERAGSLQTLANILFDKMLEREDTVPTGEFDAVRSVLSEARESPGLNEETMGIIELTASNIEWVAEDYSNSIAITEKAREHLLRCNSRHLGPCETVLAERRNQLNAAESEDASARP